MSAFVGMGELRGTEDRRHIFIDRGAKILGVAHTDSVQQYSGFSYDATRLWSSVLDNRLGLYTILFHLPKMGINCDVLLTEHEEGANSTAQEFVPDKEYNWMFSFDRQGDDVVMYHYRDEATKNLLTTFGFDVSYGSYSDIADLDVLGVKGFNFGCGMYQYHSANAYCELADLELNLELFKNFYDEVGDTRLPNDAKRTRYNWWKDEDYGGWSYTEGGWVRKGDGYSGTSASSWGINRHPPITVSGIKYFWDAYTERYRSWDLDTRAWMYLDGSKTSDAEDEYWALRFASKSQSQKLESCDGCKEYHPTTEMTLIWNSVLCPECAKVYRDMIEDEGEGKEIKNPEF